MYSFEAQFQSKWEELEEMSKWIEHIVDGDELVNVYNDISNFIDQKLTNISSILRGSQFRCEHEDCQGKTYSWDNIEECQDCESVFCKYHINTSHHIDSEDEDEDDEDETDNSDNDY